MKGTFKYFDSCYHCTPPKRHPGCHANCPEYERDRANFDAMRVNADFENKTEDAVHTAAYARTMRRFILRKGKEK
jgi:hypothetical protein